MTQPAGYTHGNIKPGNLARAALRNAFGDSALQGGSEIWIDKEELPVYNVGRPFVSDAWGPIMQTDIAGCMYRCAFCWVSGEALGVKTEGGKGFLQKKLDALPGQFRGQLTHSVDDLYAYLKARVLRLAEKEGKPPRPLAFSGGEPTLYRGALRRMAELAKQDGLGVIVYTAGFQIAQDPSFLDVFEGLQDTVRFYVSLKNATPESFSQVTGVSAEYGDSHFKAIETLLRRGFFTIPGGLMLNTFARPEDVQAAENNPVHILHERLSRIHPALPGLITYNRVTYGNVHDSDEQVARMHTRGYEKNPVKAVQDALEDYFAQKGTPILPFSAEHTRVETGGKKLAQIARRLSGKKIPASCSRRPGLKAKSV